MITDTAWKTIPGKVTEVPQHSLFLYTPLSLSSFFLILCWAYEGTFPALCSISEAETDRILGWILTKTLDNSQDSGILIQDIYQQWQIIIQHLLWKHPATACDYSHHKVHLKYRLISACFLLWHFLLKRHMHTVSAHQSINTVSADTCLS